MVEYPKCLDYITEIINPDEKDFIKAVELSRELYQNGKQIGAVDILIASMCINRGFTLVTKDNDFSRIKEIEKSFQFKIIK